MSSKTTGGCSNQLIAKYWCRCFLDYRPSKSERDNMWTIDSTRQPETFAVVHKLSGLGVWSRGCTTTWQRYCCVPARGLCYNKFISEIFVDPLEFYLRILSRALLHEMAMAPVEEGCGREMAIMSSTRRGDPPSRGVSGPISVRSRSYRRG